MKTIEEIRLQYTNDFSNNLVLLVENSDLNLKTNEQAKNLFLISKEIIDLVGERNSELDLQIIKTALRNEEVAIRFFINKINTIKNSRKWNKAIELIDFVLEFYKCPNFMYEMDFQDCFIYSKLTNKRIFQTTTSVWWFNYQKAICMKKQKNFNQAILYFQEALKTYPVYYPIIEEIITCQKIIDDYDGMRDMLKYQYNYAKTKIQLALYFVNKAYWLAINGSYNMACCYLFLALEKNSSSYITNKVNDVQQLILNLSGKNIMIDVSDMQLLKSKENDLDFSKDLLTAYVLYYSKLVSEDANLKDREYIKNILIEMANSDFPIRLVECELNEQKMISRNEYLAFEFKYPKEWVNTKATPTELNFNSFIYEFTCNQQQITIIASKLKDGFLKNYNKVINKLKNDGATVLSQKNEILFNGFNLIINQIQIKNEIYIYYFVNLKNVIFIIYTKINENEDVCSDLHMLCSSIIRINI